MSTARVLMEESTRVPVKTPSEARGWPVGIEVELENVTTMPEPFLNSYDEWRSSAMGWRRVVDNSLRNNPAEFITQGVVRSGTLATHAIERLYSWIESEGWEAHSRCGVHVHLDCRTLSLQELRTLLTAYALAEPALFSYVGEDREKNIFCIPWYRASKNIDRVGTEFSRINLDSDVTRRDVSNLRIAVHDFCKYSSLNLRPLVKFGSVEFRAAPTFARAQDCADWVNMIAALGFYALTQTPEQVISSFAEDGAEDFYRNVFGDLYNRLPEREWDELTSELDVLGVAERVGVPVRYRASVWELEERSLPANAPEAMPPPTLRSIRMPRTPRRTGGIDVITNLGMDDLHD